MDFTWKSDLTPGGIGDQDAGRAGRPRQWHADKQDQDEHGPAYPMKVRPMIRRPRRRTKPILGGFHAHGDTIYCARYIDKRGSDRLSAGPIADTEK
jgi:hypothetical protein